MGSAKPEYKTDSGVLNTLGLQGCYGWGWKIDKNKITPIKRRRFEISIGSPPQWEVRGLTSLTENGACNREYFHRIWSY